MPGKKKDHKIIKAVIFDLGKVLLRFDFDPAFRRLAKNSARSAEEIRDFFVHSGLEVLYDGGKISSRKFYFEVKRGLGLKMSFSEFRAVWNDIFTPIAPMIRLVERIHGKKRLVLVSNTNSMHFEHVMYRYPILKKFDRHILSYKEKVRKPDSRIYHRASRACRAHPEEIFYIDDRKDLTQAAKDLGFHVHTYKNDFRALTATLKKMGVL
jgi:putative hydrolase of the HAD superfamily